MEDTLGLGWILVDRDGFSDIHKNGVKYTGTQVVAPSFW
jgi:hypothetical protein